MNATATIRNPNPEQPIPVGQPRIPQLDGLRGIAVLTVVLYHYVLYIPLPHGGFGFHLQNCFRLGWSGVDLFFVLSGFLIGGILLDFRESPRYFRTFYFRRFHRIFPLYYAWLVLYIVLVLSVFPHLHASIRAAWPGWRPAVVYALFVQNLVSKQLQGISAAWLGPLWSLAVEEQFYLLMPLAVRFLPKRRLVQLLAATVLLSPILRVLVSVWMPQHADQYVATPLRADGLAIGGLLALALREQTWRAQILRNLNWLYAIIVLLFGGSFYLAATTPAPGGRAEAIWGISCLDLFCAAIILLALMRTHGWWANFCKLSALRNLGAVSYCIYVIHLAVNVICQAALHSIHETQSLVLKIAGIFLAWAVTWAVSKLSWRFLESPIVRRGHIYKY